MKNKPDELVDQEEVIDFLSEKSSFPWPVEEVKKRETHGAIIFIVGDYALKIKKSVYFSYMDFSTLDKREKVCRRELELNKKTAPHIYLDVIPITRDSANRLSLQGAGEVVEWCVLMKRFNEANLMSERLESGTISEKNIKDLSKVISAFHDNCPKIENADQSLQLRQVMVSLERAFADNPGIFHGRDVQAFRNDVSRALDMSSHSLGLRSKHGFVRRCHGDLHLGNIVMMKDEPVLFDAIEFDERLAEIDLFYDLAFVIMDLVARGHQVFANQLLNHYLVGCKTAMSLCGLKAMPLFLGLRAAIRARVASDRAAQTSGAKKIAQEAEAKKYFDLARSFLQPSDRVLIAIGGMSGTGKTTLAASLAPLFGHAPGAVHLRSDVERKAFAMVGETDRLPEKYYTPEISNRIYAFLGQKAEVIMRAGASVIVDAAFLNLDEREDIASVAKSLKVPFIGLWLTAPQDLLKERVDARIGDASDATSAVVEKQFKKNTGPIAWHPVSAGGTATDTLSEALEIIDARTEVAVT